MGSRPVFRNVPRELCIQQTPASLIALPTLTGCLESSGAFRCQAFNLHFPPQLIQFQTRGDPEKLADYFPRFAKIEVETKIPQETARTGGLFPFVRHPQPRELEKFAASLIRTISEKAGTASPFPVKWPDYN